jgi:hypothetical protein
LPIETALTLVQWQSMANYWHALEPVKPYGRRLKVAVPGNDRIGKIVEIYSADPTQIHTAYEAGVEHEAKMKRLAVRRAREAMTI